MIERRTGSKAGEVLVASLTSVQPHCGCADVNGGRRFLLHSHIRRLILVTCCARSRCTGMIVIGAVEAIVILVANAASADPHRRHRRRAHVRGCRIVTPRTSRVVTCHTVSSYAGMVPASRNPGATAVAFVA